MQQKSKIGGFGASVNGNRVMKPNELNLDMINPNNRVSLNGSAIKNQNMLPNQQLLTGNGGPSTTKN